ncbi:MAG: SDR family oxidoreductase [bacterium]|nr:SDR family oxidoreductase [bacterium]
MSNTIVITGGTSGIGLETVKTLIGLNWEIVMLARDMNKANSIISEFPNAKIEIIQTDLSDLASVKSASDYIKSRYEKIDVLLNNAGGIFQFRQETKDGFEMTFGVNHLSHFLLTTELLPILMESDSRIINVSSAAHRSADFEIENYNWAGEYSAFKTYCNSKLANIYFTKELHKRYSDQGITSYAVHPGVVKTNFGAEVSGFLRILLTLAKPFMISSKQGAATQTYLTIQDIENVKRYSGEYLEKMRTGKMASFGNDATKAEALWDKSEELVKKFRS